MNNNPKHLQLYIEWYEHLIIQYTKKLNKKKSDINKKYWITAIKLCNVYLDNLKYRLENSDFTDELLLTQNGYLESKAVG